MRELKNAPGWDSERLEHLATEIYQWLRDRGMWMDVAIFYDGKRMTSQSAVGGETIFRYNGEPFRDAADPRDFFEYVADPHILSMSFDGPLYEALNYGGKEEEELHMLLKSHGLSYGLGNAWNLTCREDG